jgi:tetratricopeptide (TPR) repeat protein
MLELDPLDPKAHHHLAGVLRAQGKVEETERLLKRHESLSRLAEQMKKARLALYEQPDDVGARLSLARTYARLGQNEKAFAQYQAVLVFDPAHVEALQALGRLYVEKGQIEEALALCRRALDTDTMHPERHRIHFTLGQIFFTAGRVGEAEEAWKQTLDLEPGFAQAHFVLGTLYESSERLELAVASYKHFLQAWEGDSLKATVAREALQRLASR